MSTRDFLMPDLGEGLTEGEIIAWLVAEGETVAVDQPIVEMATEKATVQVPVPFAGRVARLHGAAGDVMRVGSPLVSIEVETAEPVATVPQPQVAGEARGGATPAAEPSGNVLVGYGTTAPPRARRRRVVLADVAVGGEGQPGDDGEHRPRDDGEHRPGTDAPLSQEAFSDSAAGRSAGRAVPVPVPSSPLVRRLAGELGVDLGAIRGTGPMGSVSRADLEQHAAALRQGADHDVERGAGSAAAEVRSGRSTGGAAVDERSARATERGAAAGGAGPAASAPPALVAGRRPLSRIRRITAERLAASHAETPVAHAWVTADATRLLRWRDLLSARHPGMRVTPFALVLTLTARALLRHPLLNAAWDAERGEVVLHDTVNLGIAAQTDNGLVVPVLRDAHRRSAVGIAEELGRLAAAARAGHVNAADSGGSTFTVSNIGAFGVDGGTAIINPPEAGILAVGRVAERPAVVAGQLAVRAQVELSLTFDHRVCDGRDGGGFTRLLADWVENPELALGEG